MEGEKTMLQKGRLTEHFSKKEFDCKCGCDTGQISMMLVEKLEQARVDYGKSMRINSGIRCLIIIERLAVEIHHHILSV